VAKLIFARDKYQTGLRMTAGRGVLSEQRERSGRSTLYFRK